MRRTALLLAFSAMIAASPAHATSGIDCSPVRGPGPTLQITLGHVISGGIVSVRMTDGAVFDTSSQPAGSDGIAIGQSWIDEHVLWLDLVDPNVERFEGKLRVTFQRGGEEWSAVGTFVRNGRTWRMRCVEG